MDNQPVKTTERGAQGSLAPRESKHSGPRRKE